MVLLRGVAVGHLSQQAEVFATQSDRLLVSVSCLPEVEDLDRWGRLHERAGKV